jgi:hypothetical protein
LLRQTNFTGMAHEGKIGLLALQHAFPSRGPALHLPFTSCGWAPSRSLHGATGPRAVNGRLGWVVPLRFTGWDRAAT